MTYLLEGAVWLNTTIFKPTKFTNADNIVEIAKAMANPYSMSAINFNKSQFTRVLNAKVTMYRAAYLPNSKTEALYFD